MAALKRVSRTTPAIRVPDATHEKLQLLAMREDRPMGEIVMELVDRYENEVFWAEYEAAYERLRSDASAWDEYQAEIRLFEEARLDPLDEDNAYFTPEEQEAIRAEHATNTQSG